MVDPTLFRIPWFLRLTNGLGEMLGAGRLRALQLDADRLVEAAREQTGLSDFGDDGFREGLDIFVESLLRDADLSLIGRAGIRGMIVTLLANRLLIHRARQQEPHRFRTPLNRPVVITGVPRSGTTFLHRLLSEDERFRALPLWRLFKPVSDESESTIRREVDRALWVRRRLTPDLDRKHFSRSGSAEECIWLLNITFESLGLWVAAPVYGYLEWLGRRDLHRAYREYGGLLRYLQSEQPDKAFLLKAPSHSGALDALQDALPEVRTIQLHRDPIDACASLCSLFATLHSAVTRHLDLPRLGRTTVELLRREMQRNLEARRKLARPVLDVLYRDLLADPLTTVRGVYRYLGWNWDRRHEERVVRHLRRNPKDRHGRHHYELSTFGLSSEEIAGVFAPYRGDLFRSG